MAYTYGGNFNCVFKNGNATSIFLCRIGYELRSQDASTLTSVVNLRMEATTTNGGTYKTFGATRYSTIDGARVADATFDVVNTNQWVYFGDRTITIQHNADGTWSGTKSGSFTTNVKSVSAFSNWSLYSGSCSVTFTLPPIEVSRDMNIRLGDNVIKKAYVGTTEVKEVFYGDINIYPGYTRLQYIQSSGTQYINTQYIHKSNTKVEMVVDVTADTSRNYEALFGARKTNYLSNAFCMFNRFGGSNVICFNRSGNENSGGTMIYGKKITVTAEQKTVTVTDGTNTYTHSTTGTVDNGVNSMFLFNLNTAGEGGATPDTSYNVMKLYSCKFYEETNILRDFIPVKRKTDNKVGLYDLVEHKFYGNNGSGDFIAGPEV